MNELDPVRAIAADVAAHLPGYHCAPAGDGNPTLTGPHGATIILRPFTASYRARIEIIGRLPEAYQRWHGWRIKHSITVRAGRSPKAIAADITRRLLPSYESTLRAATAWVTDRNATIRDRLANTRAIAACLPGAHIGEGNNTTSTIHYRPCRQSAAVEWATIHLNDVDGGIEIHLRDAAPHVLDAVLSALAMDRLEK